MSYPDSSNPGSQSGHPYGSAPYGTPSPFGPSASSDQFLPLPYEGTGYPQYYGGAQYSGPAYGSVPAQPVGYGFTPGYPAAGFGAADPMAPYGRDPFTGEPLSNKSKVAAGLLQLFLGGFGAGRFYLGYTGIGVAQLMLTIVGWITAFVFIGFLILPVVGIWVLIDAIMMFTGSVRDSNGYKLQS